MPGALCLFFRHSVVNQKILPVFFCRDLSSFDAELRPKAKIFLDFSTFVVDFVHLLS